MSNVSEIQTYKVEERTFGTPVILEVSSSDFRRNNSRIRVMLCALSSSRREPILCALDLNCRRTGHLHDGVILLLRPESFSFFLSYLNSVIPVRFK